jgi:hypothetical protein
LLLDKSLLLPNGHQLQGIDVPINDSQQVSQQHPFTPKVWFAIIIIIIIIINLLLKGALDALLEPNSFEDPKKKLFKKKLGHIIMQIVINTHCNFLNFKTR